MFPLLKRIHSILMSARDNTISILRLYDFGKPASMRRTASTRFSESLPRIFALRSEVVVGSGDLLDAAA
jgi:hypothetical protein